MSTSSDLDKLRRDLQRRVGVVADGDIGPKTIDAINRHLDAKGQSSPGRTVELLNVVEQIHQMTTEALGWDVLETPADPPTATKDGDGDKDGEALNGLDLDWTPPEDQGSLTISRNGLDQIVFFEIGSESYYTSRLQAPTWPGWSSGVTIGIGYDLGYNSDAQIRKDWGGLLSSQVVDLLCSVNQYTGSAAKAPAASLKSKGVVIPLDKAKRVFTESTLPRYAAMARKAYPGLEMLPPDVQAAILSLVFNRGAGMANTDKRLEMRLLVPAIKEGDLKLAASLVLKMQRHWSKTSGLFKRRAIESNLILSADRTYTEDELIIV